jgi:hypothetical protein
MPGLIGKTLVAALGSRWPTTARWAKMPVTGRPRKATLMANRQKIVDDLFKALPFRDGWDRLTDETKHASLLRYSPLRLATSSGVTRPALPPKCAIT